MDVCKKGKVSGGCRSSSSPVLIDRSGRTELMYCNVCWRAGGGNMQTCLHLVLQCT